LPDLERRLAEQAASRLETAIFDITVGRPSDGRMELDRHGVVAHTTVALELVDVKTGIEKVLLNVGEKRFEALRCLGAVTADPFD
jgi:hypothetical protein